MIASIAQSDEIPSQAAEESPAQPTNAESPLSQSSARIEALAAEIRAARAATEPPAAPPTAPAVEAVAPASPSAETPAPRTDAAPPIEPRGLGMIPFIAAGPKAHNGQYSGPKSWAPQSLLAFAAGKRTQIAAAAGCLAAIGLIGGAALVERSSQTSILAIQSSENQSLAMAIKGLKAKVEALEATKSRDETADIRRTLAEMKAGLAGNHDATAGLAQLSARFDKAQHDQDARLAKLSDKIDHDGASRTADIVARLDKLEKKPAAPVVAAIPAPVTPAPGPTTLQKQATALPTPAAAPSAETTGSIGRPRPVLQAFVLRDVHNGLALIEGRDGEREVGPGDILPGAGRVERIERRGRDWAVVTSVGTIVGDGGAPAY